MACGWRLLLGLWAMVAAGSEGCGEAGYGGSWLPTLAVESVEPGILLPGTRIALSGEGLRRPRERGSARGQPRAGLLR